MARDDKERDLALLAYLRSCDSTSATGKPDAAGHTPGPGDEVDRFLRAMGYNRIEREEIRRRKPGPRTRTAIVLPLSSALRTTSLKGCLT